MAASKEVYNMAEMPKQTDESYDPKSDEGQGHLDSAANHLIQAEELNKKSVEVLNSGTGNTSAATTYRKAADEHIKLAKECRRKYAEYRAGKGLEKAFPKDEEAGE
jgi:hypothetical protein